MRKAFVRANLEYPNEGGAWPLHGTVMVAVIPGQSMGHDFRLTSIPGAPKLTR